MNHDNPSSPHLTAVPGSPSPAPPAMKLFFVHAFDGDGESNDLFVSAPDAVTARSLFDGYCADSGWEPDGKVVVFEIPWTNAARALSWHDDVKQVHEWQSS